MSAVPKEFLRESQLIGALEQICQALELTPTQHEDARERYNAVGTWLADADSPLLRGLTVYPHGSVALGTTVKPRGRTEHDVDLMSRALGVDPSLPPAALKKVIGNRLKEHAYYGSIREEKARCWRLNYASEFHMDITPSILNPECRNGGELVPDKELRCWKASNPTGYRLRFEQHAALEPGIRFAKVMAEDRADVAPFPHQTALKGILRRTVQLSKRHRDIYFERDTQGLAPISIIVTTLIAQAHEACVTATYDTELQFIIAVIQMMPRFVEGPLTTGHVSWAVWNETTQGENFAEKWNQSAALPAAFFQWHAKLLADMQRISGVLGLDQLAQSLTESFGPHPVRKAMDALTESVSVARSRGQLAVAPAVGLTSTPAAAGTRVRGNTFFGAD